jgi:O-antigen ligase
LASSFLTALPRSHFFGLVLALSLAMSSLNTKAMGLAWLMLVLLGAWVAFQNRRQVSHISHYPWGKTWLLTATLALSVKSVAVIYWSDPWSERHGELRFFLSALALYALLSWTNLKRNTLLLCAYGLTISSALGLLWVVIFGRHSIATHHIPWAGSMAMVSAFLLALSLKSNFSPAHNRIWFIGGLFALMAVLASQSRGAYGIVIWWFAVGMHHFWQVLKDQQAPQVLTPLKPGHWAFLVVVLLGLAALSQTPVIQRPTQSLQEAIKEIRISSQSTAQGANSSVGARLYMWQKSLIAIEESPWIGYGHDARKKLLLEWAEMAQSAEIKRLGHVHNEYLHQWIDHGLWGLNSQLLYLMGLIFMAWQLMQKRHQAAALSLGGMAFIHMTSSLTNVNFSHNYYTASLSFFVGLSLWLSRLESENFPS